jgi:pyruvate/2-oxoglutarate dehydrogenase complex dihydrolipoamide acyltransferase (E2) component
VALVALQIPKVGLVMENARLVRWLKSVGDVVKEGEPLLELETEKSVVEIEATHSGRLVEILLHVDQEARVGDRIGWLESEGLETAVARSVSASASAQGAASAPGAPSAPGPASAPTAASAQASRLPSAPAPGADRESVNRRVKSSPVARRVATEHAVDLKRIAGTGPRGRVQLIDVRRAIEAQQTSAADASSGSGPEPLSGAAPLSGSAPLSGTGPLSGAQPLSSMRRALARSMTLSNATVPQFTVERAVDWTALHAQRTKLCSELPAEAPRPSVNDFLLQAIARALLSFPALNATFSGDPNSPDACIVPANGAHIGLVVAVENGLLVPVFHGVEQFGLVELARLRREAVERALHGKLKREELEGATFSLSNLGARGPDRFNAIINPPQSAILAVGRQRDCVVIVNGAIQARPISQLTLTVDHRVADGRLAADFIAYLVEILEGDTWR